ncbi:MAG TPA: hypothetical protein VMU47_10515 [Caldimonas sp.]|nr:hypothetical protein [Caldimonas sp.]
MATATSATKARTARKGVAARRAPARTSAPAPRPAPAADGASTAERGGKPRLVRDSFTIPKDEYAVLEGLKLRAANLRRPTKKSELLRAGIASLSGLADEAFLRALERIPSLKTGRPKAEESRRRKPRG